MVAFRLACSLLSFATASAWDVARTPPMGFNTWNLYHCSVDADILTQTATAMVNTGLKDAGYIYVNSDDCWMSFNRSSDGSQVPDPTKFPNGGFKAVADFIHGLGMKSGLYTAKGPHTCQKRAASCLHEELDAKNWAAWGIDYVKDDSCSVCKMANGTAYTDMADYGRMWNAIQDSGRPMVLTVEGAPPADVITHGGYGNAKRVGHDISPSWSSMISLVDIGAGLWPFAHTTLNATYGGWWNDLDMIEIGNGGGSSSSLSSSSSSAVDVGADVDVDVDVEVDGVNVDVDVTTADSTMYPWAVLPATADVVWSMSSDGSVHNNGLCLTAGEVVTLTTCTNTSDQTFTLETNGNLHLRSQSTDCVALLGGEGPGLTMAHCKTGTAGLNEMFTLVGGKLCSATLGSASHALCLKSEQTKPPSGGGGNGEGFNCAADAAALARCRVHFTMWTIMKAPLLLGNDIRTMDQIALGVVKNKDAISISQDTMGVQAQRVWASANASSLNKGSTTKSLAVVISPCDTSSPTQAWRSINGVLTTTDTAGVSWCVHDVDATEEVGSWRAMPCKRALSTAPTKFEHRAFTTTTTTTTTTGVTSTAVVTPSGSHLTWNNAFGASGPVAHTRYLATDSDLSSASTWLRKPVGNDTAFQLMASDRKAIRDDDKAGVVNVGGDFCLDISNDGDSEVWAGSLAGNKWAVALLNRNPNSNSTITVEYTMFNSTATSSFNLRDVWQEQDIGAHTGSYTATVEPQSVTYLILTPASSQ